MPAAGKRSPFQPATDMSATMRRASVEYVAVNIPAAGDGSALDASGGIV
jgi:hypothetical protein